MSEQGKSESEKQSIRWYFARPGPTQRQRNSKLDEHFSGSGSDRAGDLVREGVQNAGDAARADAGKPVRVRIGFGRLPADRVAFYTAGLIRHVPEIARQKNMGGVSRVLAEGGFDYLTFEDFNTTGLTGDPSMMRRYETDPPNAFHTFFRAEGQTDKIDERKQGSKGVGKVTFMTPSHARAVFGLTCRHTDGRTLFFGTAVLHTHKLDAEDFDGDAWFGELDGMWQVQPLEDAAHSEAIERARTDFRLARQPGEPGFSVIVPWLDADQEDGITPEGVVKAVLHDHAWPILQSKLVVEVVTADGAMTTIDASTFLDILQARPSLAATVGPMAALAAWAIANPPVAPASLIGLHKDGAPRWDEAGLISEPQRDAWQAALDAGDPVAIRVPVRIRPKGRGAKDSTSHFDVFLKREPEANASAGPTVAYFRGGLSISLMGRRVPGLRGLVVADDPGIAGFLRAAENPSHTKWNAKPLKDRYTLAPGTLAFVVEAARGLATLLAGDPAERDASIWANELSLPAGDDKLPGPAGGGGARKQKKKEPEPPEPIPPPPPKKRPYAIVAASGGVDVGPSGRPFPALPADLELRLAYHVRGKDPLARWTKDDFNLSRRASFPTEGHGCQMIRQKENRVTIRIDSPTFYFRITGFDTRRELFCKPRMTLPSGAPAADTDGDDADGPGVAGGAQ